MIIDCILDRYDGAAYDPKAFYHYCNGYSSYGDKIAAAMDGGTENDIKAAIAEYISGEYNPLIIAYVYSVNWLDPAPGGIVPTIDIMPKH